MNLLDNVRGVPDMLLAALTLGTAAALESPRQTDGLSVDLGLFSGGRFQELRDAVEAAAAETFEK